MTPTQALSDRVIRLRERITDEVFFSLGLGRGDTWVRRLLGPLFRLPTTRFARIADRLETAVVDGGLPAGGQAILDDFSLTSTPHGLENIPAKGPVLIVCNHPGAYDSVALASIFPRRDLKMLASDVPFTRTLENTGQYLIYVPEDTPGRMAALKAGVAHLQAGGALLTFPLGEVEPDPAISTAAGDRFKEWSPSIEVMLRKVPETRLVYCIGSSILLKKFVNSPLTKIRRQPFHQQKMGELLQIFQQLISPKSLQINFKVSFSQPVTTDKLPARDMMPAIAAGALRQLEEHCRIFSLPG